MKMMPILISLALGAILVPSCVTGAPGDPYGTVLIEETSYSPGYPVHVDYGPDPVLVSGQANACLLSPTHDGHDVCRVLTGYKGTNTANQHWHIRGNPVSVTGSGSPYGLTLTYKIGVMYEGCDYDIIDGSYFCTYQVSKFVTRNLNGGTGYNYLKKTWDWVKYQGDALGCAEGIGGVLAGAAITFPLMTACVAGPEKP